MLQARKKKTNNSSVHNSKTTYKYTKIKPSKCRLREILNAVSFFPLFSLAIRQPRKELRCL